MSASFWLAVAAYLLPTFPLGYFWHLKVFKRRYDEPALYRPQVIIPMGLGSMLLQALAFAWAYPKLFSDMGWFGGALGFFVVFGLLSWSLAVLPVAAKYKMTSVSRFLALETGFVIVQFAVVSPLIALAYTL